MSGMRAAMVLVAALAVAGCGRSSAGSGTPAAATPAAKTQAPANGGGGPNLGTLKVTLGRDEHSSPILTCGDSGNTLGVIAYAGELDKDGVATRSPATDRTRASAG